MLRLFFFRRYDLALVQRHYPTDVVNHGHDLAHLHRRLDDRGLVHIQTLTHGPHH